MPTPQSAICAPTGRFGLFLTLRLRQGGGRTVRQAAAALPALTAELARNLGVPSLTSAIGIGAQAWPQIFVGPPPAGLAPFPALAEGTRQAPATPGDILVHIHSDQHDANFLLARQVMAALADSVERVDETHGFRYREGRDLTGFMDGTENPQGEARAVVALVAPEADLRLAGGSYLSVQRYVHDLARWETLSPHQQEETIGRTRDTDEELADDLKPASAHIARVVIEEDGEELEILRHSMPYGSTAECGLYFVAYCNNPHTFRKMLTRMIQADDAGPADRLLDFTRAVSGVSVFVPSVEMLERSGS